MFSLKLIHSHNTEFLILLISTKIPHITEFETCRITTLLTDVACYHPVILAVPFLNPQARVETYFKLYSLFLSLALPCNWDVFSERAV